MTIFGQYFLLTTDPGNIKVVLSTKFNNFEKGNSDHGTTFNRAFIDSPPLLGFFFRESVASVFGESVFNVDGELYSPVIAIALS